MENTRKLTRAQARRAALAAQGFANHRSAAKPVGIREVQRTIDRLALFQIDSINIVTRAHLMPLFSRLGAYDPALLTRAFEGKPRRLFEYWAHEASLVDISLAPALRWRMAANAERAERPQLVERVHDELGAVGPSTARQLSLAPDLQGHESDRGHWGWNWSGVKKSLEWQFGAGQVSAAARNSQFERIYDVAEHVLPEGGHAGSEAPLTREEQILILVERSARALGVASQRCLADYFRLGMADTAVAIEVLVARGDLEPVAVQGWETPTWLWRGTKVPRKLAVRALVSPFDSLVFERARLLALFDCHYRIEIYVPEPKRRYGYYVYLFVLGDRVRARVDLKADRARGILIVKSAWSEPSESWPAEEQLSEQVLAEELLAELRLLAGWQGLDEIEINARGTLAATLTDELGRFQPG